MATGLNREFKAHFAHLLKDRQKEKGIITKMRVKVAAKMLVIVFTTMETKQPYRSGLLIAGWWAGSSVNHTG